MRDLSSLCLNETHKLRPDLNRHFALAYEWLEAALSLSGHQRPQVQQDLLSLALRHDERLAAVQRVEQSFVASEDFFISNIITKEGNLSSARVLRRSEREEREGLNEVTRFSLLCSGESLHGPSAEPLSEARCRLSTRDDPYLFLCEYQILEAVSQILPSTTSCRDPVNGAQD